MPGSDVRYSDLQLRGTLAARPTASIAGRRFIATDAGVEYYDDGSAWHLISPLASYVYKRTSGDYTTTSTTFADVDGTNMAPTITTGAHRVLVGFVGSVSQNQDYGLVYFDIEIDGTRVGEATAGIQLQRVNDNAASAGYTPIWDGSFTFLTDVLSAGSHTIKLKWRVGSGTGKIYGGSSGNPYAQFYVMEQGG